MFELYIYTTSRNEVPVEAFLCLSNAVKAARNVSILADVTSVDVISAETGEIIFQFCEGIMVYVCDSIYYD